MRSGSVAAAIEKEPRAIASKPRRYGTEARHALLFIWAGGFTLVLARFLIAMAGIGKLRSGSVKVALDRFDAERLAARSGMTRDWELRISRASSPSVAMTWGIAHPVVLLPQDADQWSRECLEAVLLHELAHAKRRDIASQLVSVCACATYWFHPAVWMAARAMRAEAELAADNAVLLGGVKPSEYASQLLSFATRSGEKHSPVIGVSASLITKSKIEARICAIVNASGDRRRLSVSDIVPTVTVALIVIALCAAVRPAVFAAGERQGSLLAAFKPVNLLSGLRKSVRSASPIRSIASVLRPLRRRLSRSFSTPSPIRSKPVLIDRTLHPSTQNRTSNPSKIRQSPDLRPLESPDKGRENLNPKTRSPDLLLKTP